MSCYRVKLADCVFQIEDEQDSVIEFFKDFIIETSDLLDFRISTIRDEVVVDNGSAHEKTILGWQFTNSVRDFYSRLLRYLVDYNAMLFHGAAISYLGNSYLFTAPSGTGKTTHILQWLSHLTDAFVVNGDKPFLKFTDDGTVLACGSPWAGKENMYTNTMVPLRAIILMERAEDNHIEQISFAEAFPLLLQQVYRPDDEDKMRKTLRLMQRLPQSVTFWLFKCNNFKDDCFDVAYNALVGDKHAQGD